MSLSQQKSDLFHTNVEIHNFLAELSCCPGVSFNTPPSSLGRKDKQQHNVSFGEVLSGCKVQLFWEGYKNLRNLPQGFDIYLVNVKTMRKIAQIFVAFSEKLNFMTE